MFCSYCGAENEEYAKFCDRCGEALNVVPQQTLPVQDTGRTFGKLSKIFGIVWCAILPIAPFSAFPIFEIALIVLSFVFGSIGKSRSEAAGYKNGNAKIGMTLASIAAVIFALFFIVFFAIIGCVIMGQISHH